MKTKIQAFIDIFSAALLSVHVWSEDVEITERFTNLGSDIHVSACCEPEVDRRLGWVWGVIVSLDPGVWCYWYLYSMKVRVFKSVALPILLYGCGT